MGCYLSLADGVYAVTIWPPLVWTGFGLALCLPGIRRRRTRWLWILAGSWVLFWLIFGEERSHVMGILGASPNGIRVVSLNCAGGDPNAAGEAFENGPDLVLLQESPSEEDILSKARATGKTWKVLHGPDASIATTGDLEPIELPRGTSNFVAAKVTLPGIGKVFVVSLRLQPPVFRLDYWNPDCWKDYSENKRRRRAELQEVADWVKAHSEGLPIIAGGDYNTPPDRATFAPFAGWLSDATNASGYTAVNEFPLARIDQIWVSKEFAPQSSSALKTIHSDHRKVSLWMTRRPSS